MGLLEKAKEKQEHLDDTKEQKKKENKSIQYIKSPKKVQETEKTQKKKDHEKTSNNKENAGLLEKAKGNKEQKFKGKIKKVEKKPFKKGSYSGVKTSEGREIIDQKTGFGYKGLGTRRIVFDHSINEYIYEVEEPVLSEFQEEVKKELSHLFKMLADVDVWSIDKEEKEKYLKDTLEKIVKDNNIHFLPKEKTSPINLKNLRQKKDKTLKDHSKSEGKKSLLNLSSKNELTEEEKKAKDKIFYHLFREFIGYGRIDIVMKDEGIEDISCDGYHVPIFLYHKKYDEITTNIQFEGDKELNSFVVRLAQICGKQISIFSPIVDGKLPDGSRLQTTLAKTVTHGSTFTIRRFKENPLTPIDLIGFQSFSLEMGAYFWLAIENGASILFCGGTAAGKTSALNALSLFVPAQHKIVSIEDTREVNLPHKNWIAGTTRQGFSAADDKTGKDIDMFDLIRAALRQRPKVVMVGEVRGKEAYSLFQAMSTGHTAYATVHASSIHTLIQRLENPPIELPRALLTSLDIIIFQNAISMGEKYVRRMTSVTEVIKLDPDTNQLIFMEPYRWISKTDDRFESSGTSKILNNIRLQNDWSEERLQQELENRKTVLEWMIKENIRDYKDVGRIVADYSKYPEKVLEIAERKVKN